MTEATVIDQNVAAKKTVTVNNPTAVVEKKDETLTAFVAIIFSPGKINKSSDPGDDTDLTGITRRELMRCGQHYQIYDQLTSQFETFFLHPGTNLGLHQVTTDDEETITRLSLELWLKTCENPINRSYLMYNDPFFPQEKIEDYFSTSKARSNHRYEAIEVMIPDSPDDWDEPGYRNFSPANAAKLVLATMHETWVDRYLVGEKRPQVLTLAERHKKEILRIRTIKAQG